MEMWKQRLRRLLFPPAAVVACCVPIAAALLVYALGFAGAGNPVAYFSYVFSAYALVIFCARAASWPGKIRRLLHRNPYAHRYLTDLSFRTRVSLYASVGLNLVYAVLKSTFGLVYHSVWFGTLGAYYVLLTVMRFLLLRHAHRNAFGAAPTAEWRRYRLCGAILVPMTLALSGVVILVIRDNEGFRYPGYLIYVMALYAFYAVITAILHVAKYRRYQSPVLTASKIIKLASALVSILSLETAMISQFGDSGDPLFRRAMVAGTGGVICTVILAMALYMIIRATGQLKSGGSMREAEAHD